MTFSFSFSGVKVSISPSASGSVNKENFNISSVRHCDGRIEADVCNFSGTITIEECFDAAKEDGATSSRDVVVVDATPEEVEEEWQLRPEVEAGGAPTVENGNDEVKAEREGSFSTTANSSDLPEEATGPYVCPIPHHPGSHPTVEIDDEDDPGTTNDPSPRISNSSGGPRFDVANVQVIPIAEPDRDLRLHEACASEEMGIEDLRDLLTSKPELASVRDQFGDYPAHVFANNNSFIYTCSDADVGQFVFELYTACPGAFLTEGYAGRIPFAEAIVDWVDDCHQVYSSSRDSGEIFRSSEIKALTKSTRVINTLCVREEVQRLVQLPSNVSLPVKVMYSFKMLSFILDKLSQSAEEISTRREFWVVASKRRDKIIGSMASIPFLVRTILLIENERSRNALIDLSVVRNLMFRPESVDLWLVALLSGGERARACASDYLCLVSKVSLSGLFGRGDCWNGADVHRFQFMRRELYTAIGKLVGFLPCMLHLGDSLYEVATKRGVKYIVESTVGRPLSVYKNFMELFLLLLLMTSYRIVVELVYAVPSEKFLSQYRELWVLSLSIAAYFVMHDIAVLFSLSSTEERLVMRFVGVAKMVQYATMASVITVLSMLHVNGTVEGRNYVGIVSGLLWWNFLLHIKGMSKNLSTLIYTIMQIATTLKYFLMIFLIALFFFADMVDLVKKTSGECDDAGDMDLENFCSLTPLQSFLAMYGVMIGGVEIASLEGSSALVCLIFVAASFCGVIVLVNILIAIVTGEYEKAQEQSCIWFARARLEAAAEQVAIEKVWNPPNDFNAGLCRKLWRICAFAKYSALMVLVEVYLIKSLLSCASLNEDGILGDFLYVALILCAILYHMFVALSCTYIFAKHICKSKGLQWLRGSRIHIALLKICLKPVSTYLKNLGLGRSDCCGASWEDKDAEEQSLSRDQVF